MPASDTAAARRTKTEIVAEAIIGSIASGALRPGDRVESERRLSERFGVSLGTVQKALGELQHRGVLVREHGRGTFVSQGNTTVDARFVRFNDEAGQPLPLYIHLLSVRRVAAEGNLRRFFNSRQPLARIERLISVGGRFDLFSEFVLEAVAFEKLTEGEPEAYVRNLRQAIADRLMLPTLRVKQEIRFAPWPDHVATELGAARGTTGFVMELHGYTLEDKPLFYQRIFAPPFTEAALVIER